MVFQFEHVEGQGSDHGKWTTEKYDFQEFKKVMIKWQEELAGKAWNSLFLGNHDQPRSVSRFGNDNPAYRETSAKMLATCLHMLKGTPYIYQGEEIGMTNADYMNRVVKSCLDFVKNFDSEHDNLLFTGSTGVGKTFLTNCIARKLMDSYHSVIYFSAGDLFDVFSKKDNLSPAGQIYVSSSEL